MMLRSLMSLSLLFAGILAPRIALADKVSLGGGVMVEIPAPEGSVRIDGVYSEFDREFEDSLPQDTKSLIVFGTDEDLQSLKYGEMRKPTLIYSAQLIGRKATVSKERFAKVIADVEEKVKQESNNDNSGPGESDGEKGEIAEAGPGNPEQLGVFGKGDNWVGYGVRYKVGNAGGKANIATKFVVYINLGEKLVGLVGVRLGNDEAVVANLKATMEGWRDGVFAKNADLKLPGSGFSWKIVVGVVALIVVFVLLFKRRSPAGY